MKLYRWKPVNCMESVLIAVAENPEHARQLLMQKVLDEGAEDEYLFWLEEDLKAEPTIIELPTAIIDLQ